MSNGTLISIEGIDGSGKTTLIEGNAKSKGLKSVYTDSVFTTEPNEGTRLGDFVRDSIKNSSEDLPPVSIFFLFLSEHANHVNNVIQPSLDKGKTVICDRYIDSRYAYQTHEIDEFIDGDTLSWIKSVQENGWTEIPDLTIILDISAETSIERTEGDEIFEDKQKLQEYRDVYLNVADTDDRYAVVDAERAPEEVFRDCTELIDEVIN